MFGAKIETGLMIFLLGVLPACGKGQESTAPAYYKQSLNHRKRGEFEHAIKSITKAIELAPNTGSYYDLRGLVSLEMVDRANLKEELFPPANEEEKGFDQNHLSLFYALRQYSFDKSILPSMGNEDLLRRIREGGIYKQGRLIAEESIRAMRKRRAAKKGVSDFNKAIELEPFNANFYFHRGLAHKSLGDLRKAIHDMDRTIQLDPEFHPAFANLTWIHLSSTSEFYRDVKLAKKYGTRACAITKWQNSDDLERLACVCSETREFEKALQFIQKAIEVSPERRKEKRKWLAMLFEKKLSFHLAFRGY